MYAHRDKDRNDMLLLNYFVDNRKTERVLLLQDQQLAVNENHAWNVWLMSGIYVSYRRMRAIPCIICQVLRTVIRLKLCSIQSCIKLFMSRISTGGKITCCWDETELSLRRSIVVKRSMSIGLLSLTYNSQRRCRKPSHLTRRMATPFVMTPSLRRCVTFESLLISEEKGKLHHQDINS